MAQIIQVPLSKCLILLYSSLILDTDTKPCFSIKIHNLYEIRRTIEEVSFQSDVGNVQLLMHASGPHNYLGILSRYGIMVYTVLRYTTRGRGNDKF